MCGCSKGNVRNFEIVLDSKNARQVQNGICLAFFDPEAPEKNNHLTPFAVRTKQIRHCYEKLGIKKLYLHLDGSIPILKSKLQLTGYFTKALRCNGFQV